MLIGPCRGIVNVPDVAVGWCFLPWLREAARAKEDTMSSHPNVAVIDRMTQALVENDRETLARIFADDMVFHGRGPVPFRSQATTTESTACWQPFAPSSS